MSNKFTLEYFKEKFEAIPESQWTTGDLVIESEIEGQPDCHCALGHCGMTSYDKPTEEALALVQLFGGKIDPSDKHFDTEYDKVYKVNDYNFGKPKNNILEKINTLLTQTSK